MGSMGSKEILRSHENMLRLGLTITNPKISPESKTGTKLLLVLL